MFSDLSNSTSEYFYGSEDETTVIYDKLFYGCNLPAINRSGTLYIPEWDIDEIDIMLKVMNSGAVILCKYLGIIL